MKSSYAIDVLISQAVVTSNDSKQLMNEPGRGNDLRMLLP